MTLDIAMGGSTNTVLHLLAAAYEGEVSFDMKEIDRLSRKTPTLCKVAPTVPHYHMEDVHRAGGVMSILLELKKAGLLNEETYSISEMSMGDLLEKWDILQEENQVAKELFQAAPGGVPTQVAFSQNKKWESLDTDREKGCIRSFENAYHKDGGLVVLYGNIALQGCILKTAGVDESCWYFKGKAHVFESQDECVTAILTNRVKEGEVVVVRYEGPRGGPGMQEMLYPTSYLKSKGLGAKCALITDGRFSGGTSGLSIGHISPEAANGGNIALIEQEDLIEIDIAKRKIELNISSEELEKRREKMLAKGEKAFRPAQRQRKVSKALRIYAELSTSADQGAVRKEVP